jgi:hypothetical protein
MVHNTLTSLVYSITGKGSSIYSSCQLEAYQNEVNDKSSHIQGGLQRIVTSEGYVIILQNVCGLALLPIRPYTDSESETFPHVILTA